jgi:hypothetical protein
MRYIDVLVPKGLRVGVRIRQVEGLKRPQIVMGNSGVERLPIVGSFVVQNIEALGHTLGGNYDELPPAINKVRWGIIDGGYSDLEVRNEVNQTLKGALGDPLVKKLLEEHISELLLPLTV